MKIEGMDGIRTVYSRRRTMALEIKSDETLVLRLPYGCTARRAEAFVLSHRPWIEKQIAALRQRRGALPQLALHNGAQWPMGGAVLRLQYYEGACADVEDGVLYCPAHADAAEQLTALYRRLAKPVLGARLQKLAAQYGFCYKRHRISDAHGRWGSCSSGGTISLNWRLLLLPGDVIDYVMLHELSHTRHMDHSPAFWQQVEAVCPRWRMLRRALAGFDLYLAEPTVPLQQGTGAKENVKNFDEK